MVKRARAAIVPEPNGRIEIREYDIPELVPGSVLLKVANAGVCGTDVHLWHGKLSGVPYPLILGHEVVGTIEQVGPTKIRNINGEEIEPGDRVVFHDVTNTCYSCWHCLVAKTPTKCPHREVYGITRDSKKWPHLVGGYAEYVYLTPGTHIVKLPDHVSFNGASALGCAMPTAVHTTRRSPLEFGTNVVVQGAGPVGLMITILANISGASTIVAIDQAKNRLELAKRFGATHTLDISSTSLEERIQFTREITQNHGPDIVYEATGNPLAFPEGIELVREGGTYTVCGQYTDGGHVTVSPHLMNKKHLDLRMVWGSETKHLYEAIGILSSHYHRFPFEKLVTHEFSLEKAQEALETQELKESVKAVVKPWD